MKANILRNKAVLYVALSICVNLLIEMLNRRSIIDGAVHICTAPHIFIYNTLIVLFTYTVALIFPKRKFSVIFVTMLWCLAGITDFILLFFRKTPFTANDFTLIGDAFKIGPVYLGKVGFIAVVAAVAAAIGSIIYLWFKSPKVVKSRRDYLKSVLLALVIGIIVYFTGVLGLEYGILPKHYSNIGQAYSQYGFAYCFTSGFFKHGIVKPANYSDKEVRDIVENTKDNKPKYKDGTEDDKPNIIFLQLESFMNPNLIKNVTYTENPVKYFHELIINCPSGYLSVPAFGAGTANTEFEVMTGINLDDFGPGEYPYKTVLKSETCESAAYIAESYGYKTHVIHNNDASFYGRNSVLGNLGFMDFTSIEYMGPHETTPTGWAKDDVLVNEICKVLDSTEERDYIYAISVQGHGDYPDDIDILDQMKPEVYENGFFDKASELGFVYYINQINEMDDFIKRLTDTLSTREEKTIVVMYGDHLPGFSFENDNLYNGDIYQTQYVIWSNYGLWLPKKNLEAYQLYSWVFNAVGITDGIINSYHRNNSGEEDYLANLTVLEYDMLYGDGTVYGKAGRYAKVDMKMGTDNQYISNVYNYGDHICVEGGTFTSYCAVMINDKIYDAVCVNENMLTVEDISVKTGDNVKVVWRGEDKTVLSATEKITVE